MSRASQIIAELNNLPRGCLTTKTISNKEYTYLQYREKGKVVSEYVPVDEIEHVRSFLGYRTTLEEELFALVGNSTKLAKVSKRAINLDGYLMMADKMVATFDNGKLTYVDEKLAPLYILRTRDLEGFLSLRCMDKSRTNYRILRKVLNIKTDDEKEISLHAYGATITDNYWFKTKGSKLKYKDISFNNDFYCDLALKGDVNVFPKQPLLNPELTTTGSFEKCWKLINNEWWLYKSADQAQLFSEIFVSKLAKRIGIATAEYYSEEGYVKTKNFANEYNFEPIVAIAGGDDSYENVFSKIKELNSYFLKDYIKLIYLDCLVKNVDRHNENMGVLRDKQTGELISLAPNFDNNVSLLACQSKLNLDASGDGFIDTFKKFLKNNSDARKIYKSLKLTLINESMIKSIIDEIDIEVDEKLVIDFVVNRYKYLRNLQDKI